MTDESYKLLLESVANINALVAQLGIEKSDNDVLLADYVADFIARSRSRIQPSTYDHYVDMLNIHILPYFLMTEIKVVDVHPRDLEVFYQYLLDRGLNPNTVIKHHAVIRSALQDAVKNGIIKTNPADLADKPKRVKPKIEVYTLDEVRKLWNIFRGSRIEVPVFLALVFGLRKSEALGLQWSDIDLDNRILHINHKAVRVKVDGKFQMVVSDILKTEASNTFYKLDDYTVRYFTELWERLKFCARSSPYKDFLCIDPDGVLLHSDYVTSKFSKTLKKYGLKPIPFKNLRSSCLTAIGSCPQFSPKQVQGYARHANFKTTFDVYCQDDRSVTADEMSVITSAIFE